jgi:branched-subunit amino acid transport protein
VIVGMGVLNFVIRFTPMAILSNLRLPAALLRWLSYVPISVMGALVATQVFAQQRSGGPLTQVAAVCAASLTAVVFWRWRSFLGATLIGMASFVLLKALIG